MIEIGEATSSVDVILAMMAVLHFPEWCGAGWDSINDVYDE